MKVKVVGKDGRQKSIKKGLQGQVIPCFENDKKIGKWKIMSV